MTSAEFQIHANRRMNTTLHLAQGHQYRFRTSGRWTDAHISSEASGYEKWYLAPFRSLRRVPHAPYFCLIGMIDGHVLLLRNGATLTAPTSGPLDCFANDLWFMYWNNKGVIELEITELVG